LAEVNSEALEKIEGLSHRENNLEILENVFSRKKASPPEFYHNEIFNIKNSIYYITKKETQLDANPIITRF
jgi:hypothetical protein